MPNIISASRRTDIPAFYSDWFMNRVKAGYCKYQPPMNPVKEVSLAVDDVLAFVFWSRNYEPMIKKGYLDKLKSMGYDFFLHFTIVDYPGILDPNVIDSNRAVKQFRFLSKKFGKNTIRWRFDPIVFSSITTIDERLQAFEKLAALLGPYTDSCIVSVMDLYGKTIRNMAEKGIECYDPFKGIGPLNYTVVRNMLKKMVVIAKKTNIDLYTCCEKLIREDKEVGISKGHCIDTGAIANIIKDTEKRDITLNLSEDHGQRKKFDCGCFKSIDIGVYNTCIHGCLYCYANKDKNDALKYFKAHDSSAEIIIDKKREKKYS